MLTYCIKCKTKIESLNPKILKRKPGFTYSAGGHLQKNKERIEKFTQNRKY